LKWKQYVISTMFSMCVKSVKRELRSTLTLDRFTPEPRSWAEAIKSDKAAHGRAAAQEVLDALTLCGTWEPGKASASLDGSSDGSLTVPTTSAGTIVAKRFSQKAGIDYHEVFAPVVRWDSFRTFFAIAGSNGLTVKVLP
jgi:hypothetical protein